MSMEATDVADTCKEPVLTCCGCCEGVSQETPQTIDNRPGLSAIAFLAFTIDPSVGAFGTALTAPVNAQVMPEPVPSVIVPVGTRVQSIPGPGEKPQAFETIEQINARAEWNAMPPLPTQPQQVG